MTYTYTYTAAQLQAHHDTVDAGVVANVESFVFDTSQTYTPNPSAIAIKVIVVGGGGAGGGVDGQGAGTRALASGGNAGAASVKLIQKADIESSYSIVIGAGGAGVSAGDGGDGGASSFIGDDTATTSITAPGGLGGALMVATSGNSTAQPSNNPTQATGGDINTYGATGTVGSVVVSNAASFGNAGGSFFGDLVRGVANSNGVNGRYYGSAGGGSGVINVATNYPGGDGFQGVVMVQEFFE